MGEGGHQLTLGGAAQAAAGGTRQNLRRKEFVPRVEKAWASL